MHKNCRTAVLTTLRLLALRGKMLVAQAYSTTVSILDNLQAPIKGNLALRGEVLLRLTEYA